MRPQKSCNGNLDVAKTGQSWNGVAPYTTNSSSVVRWTSFVPIHRGRHSSANKQKEPLCLLRIANEGVVGVPCLLRQRRCPRESKSVAWKPIDFLLVIRNKIAHLIVVTMFEFGIFFAHILFFLIVLYSFSLYCPFSAISLVRRQWFSLDYWV